MWVRLSRALVLLRLADNLVTVHEQGDGWRRSWWRKRGGSLEGTVQWGGECSCETADEAIGSAVAWLAVMRDRCDWDEKYGLKEREKGEGRLKRSYRGKERLKVML